MLRAAVGQQLDHDPNFRWRGESVTRIENLSDIAFALALGMLISGVDAPRTVADLGAFLIFVVPAAFGVAVLLGIWISHYTFFRRYGVADKTIIIYNAALIFVVLYMAYPLRFAFDSLFAFVITQLTGDYSRSLELGVNSFETSGIIIAIFGVTYGVAYGLLWLMYGHVLRKADRLDLNDYERAMTRQTWVSMAINTVIALTAAGLAYFTALNGFAGFILALNSLTRVIAQRISPVQQVDVGPLSDS